jgi:hypothetical protein
MVIPAGFDCARPKHAELAEDKLRSPLAPAIRRPARLELAES